jgi:arylsulfatase A-like enzyme
MMAAVDDQIGNIVSALDAKGMLESTLFIYLSDNGGVPHHGANNGNFRCFVHHRSDSRSNFDVLVPVPPPLPSISYSRGQKATFFEGGVRVPSFISGQPIAAWSDSGKTFLEMVQPSDLYASILSFAGIPI